MKSYWLKDLLIDLKNLQNHFMYVISTIYADELYN